MTPPKQHDPNIPCESSFCLVPALKESIDKAEGFNQEYRTDVKATLQGIQQNTGDIAVYLAKQEALRDRVDKQEKSLEQVWTEVRMRPSRKELLLTAATMVAILGFLITFTK